jgi:hypothetical protein
MLRLCYKDYLAGRWPWLLTLLVFLIFALQAAHFRSGLMFLVSPALVLAWILISEVLDDKDKIAVLYISLPLTRPRIVRGRYLLAGGLTLAGAMSAFGVIGIARALPAARPADALWPHLFAVEGLAGFFLASAILVALYLPLTFRFGLYRANLLFPAAFIAAAGAVFGLERLATRVLHLFQPVFTPDLARDPAAGLAALFARARDALGGPVLLLIALALSALAAAVSLRCSVHFYSRREF